MAALLAVLALVLWQMGVHRIGLSPFFLYLAAVTVASAIGGLGPGLLVILFGVIAASCAYTCPGFFILEWPRGVLQLVLFLFVSLAIAILQQERLRLLTSEQSSRRRAERLMAEQAAMLEQMTEAVLIADPEGHLTYLNAAAKRIFAVPDIANIPVTRMDEWIHVVRPSGEDVSGEEFALARAARGEIIKDVERVIEHPDGSRAAIVASARQVRATDGRVLGAIATVRDVTTERELERQRQGLLSAVVHDLKSPLATIKGVSQLLHRRLMRTPGLPPDLHQSLDTGLSDIDLKVTQMVQLINDLVEMDRRGDALERRDIDLVPLIRQLATVIDRGTEEHTIRVETDVRELVGQWDGARLARVFENILSNAIKYSPDGGVIEVRVERLEGGPCAEAVVSVTDPGIGIPQQDQSRIFEQFYRAGNAMEVASGTGIGLAAVKQTVESHGGSIGIESVEGRGTTVRVRLPLRCPAGVRQRLDGVSGAL